MREFPSFLDRDGWTAEDYLINWFEGQMNSLNWSLKHRFVPRFIRKRIIVDFFGKMTWMMYDQPHPLGGTDKSPYKFGIGFSELAGALPSESSVHECYEVAREEFLSKSL